MRIIFRVDASIHIGIGHVMRCLSLAVELKNNGIDVRFICRKHKGHLINIIRSRGIQVYELEIPKKKISNNELFNSSWLGTSQLQDAKECIEKISQIKVNLLIVDHYGIDHIWQNAVKGCYERLMVIDDLADRTHNCNILLDQNFGRIKEDYIKLVPKSCKVLLGPKYALLRSEFAQWRKYSLNRRKYPELKKIFVSMGGVDSENKTAQILEQLKSCKLPNDVKVTVVMGDTAPHLKYIMDMAEFLPFKVEVKSNVSNMAEIMSNCDIAIGGSGSTTWERCCLGLPSIQIILAENQKFIAEKLEINKSIKLMKGVHELPFIFKDAENWMKDISIDARKQVDGLGLTRILKNIYK
jgi:UDP-2,4-diacetamido-2,4,6-trideoxy-beta-L-altropyranose hydrolase